MSRVFNLGPTPTGEVLRLDVLLLILREGPRTELQLKKELGLLAEDRLESVLRDLEKKDRISREGEAISLTVEAREHLNKILA